MTFNFSNLLVGQGRKGCGANSKQLERRALIVMRRGIIIGQYSSLFTGKSAGQVVSASATAAISNNRVVLAWRQSAFGIDIASNHVMIIWIFSFPR